MKKFLRSLFSDTNDINEKTIIGICSFTIMVLYSLFDVFTGIFGKDIEINERIYTSFETIVLGAFIISAGEKISKVIKGGKENG